MTLLKKSFPTRFPLLFLYVLVISTCALCQAQLHSGDSEIPIYPSAVELKKATLQNGLIEAVSFEVKIPYPASDVLAFYERELPKLGYEPYVEKYYEYADRKWSFFEDGTEKGAPDVATLNASWANQKLSRRAILMLRYMWTRPDKSKQIILNENDELKVKFQIMPFSEAPPPHRLQ